MKQQTGLSITALKWIALLFMVLDHIHYFFEFTGHIPVVFSMVGRLAAPLFLFALVQGFSHTRNRKKYFLRIYLMAAGMSSFVYFMSGGLLVRPDGFFPLNGMLTTFTVLLVIWQGMDWLAEKRFIRGITAVVLPLIWPFLLSYLVAQVEFLRLPMAFLGYSFLPMWSITPDGGLPMIILGIAMYLLRKNHLMQVCGFAVLKFLMEFVVVYLMFSGQPDFSVVQMFTDYYEWYGILAAVFMLFYNGSRGKGYQRFFYLFYPAHIYILYGISWLWMIWKK